MSIIFLKVYQSFKIIQIHNCIFFFYYLSVRSYSRGVFCAGLQILFTGLMFPLLIPFSTAPSKISIIDLHEGALKKRKKLFFFFYVNKHVCIFLYVNIYFFIFMKKKYITGVISVEEQ